MTSRYQWIPLVCLNIWLVYPSELLVRAASKDWPFSSLELLATWHLAGGIAKMRHSVAWFRPNEVMPSRAVRVVVPWRSFTLSWRQYHGGNFQ